MTIRPAYRALLRLCLIPVGLSLGFGIGAYQSGVWWGEFAVGAGIFFGILLLPFVWRHGVD
jgi:hypothetical protein